MATFLIGGIWHGAGWTFVFWGFLHGLALVIQNMWSRVGFKLQNWIAWLITFNFINISWVFFRSKEWSDAIKVLEGMFGLSGISLPGPLYSKLSFLHQYGVEFGKWISHIDTDNGLLLIPTLFLGFIFTTLLRNSLYQLNHFRLNSKTVFISSISFAIAVLSLNKVSEFLYFNF
jgi:D-alanyl-lipoteichoic acid acyltransferase DltB (MBOAT superfamily)